MDHPALPPVHIVIMQPLGYVHSLGLLDPARYLRYQLSRFGVNVTLAKNRLREDAVNIVFGAHLGFDPAWRTRHACIFVNLEQLGDGGASMRPEYLQLLRHSIVADYHPANLAAYSAKPQDIPLLPLLHAPYLASAAPLPLQDRPIDLLFFGSVNERRRAFIDRIEATGVQVTLFDRPIYGPERDDFILQAKAVLNCHFYDTARFEQVRAQHCLSLGTPVISERLPGAYVPAPFDEAVHWLDGAPDSFFREHFGTPAFEADAQQRLTAWRSHDPMQIYADFIAFATGCFQGHGQSRPRAPWQPRELHIGSGKDYRTGWLNIDIVERTQPDLVLDLSQPQHWPLHRSTRLGAPLELAAGSLQRVKASHVLEHVADLPMLMSNVLALLREGGEMDIEVPYEKAPAAWQDPTHVRAMNENSWIYYTDWFWYLGWFEHRFELVRSAWLGLDNQPCSKEAASFMQVVLRKVKTSPYERTVARTMCADLALGDDAPPAANVRPLLTTTPTPHAAVASTHLRPADHARTKPRCCVCGHDVPAWKPHPHLDRSSEFMELMQTIGSDMTNYQCPACGCNDRDRHLWLYFQAIGLPAQLHGAAVLHLAPERLLEPLIAACGPARYVRGDLHPTRPDHVVVDAQTMTFADGEFDLIIGNHLLEHVADPARALAEFYRCLRPGGLLVAQTPYSPLLKTTFELKDLPGPAFATMYYGQDDHVRLFADDLVDLFRHAGFEGKLLHHGTMLPQVDALQAGVNAREPFFVFNKPRALAAAA